MPSGTIVKPSTSAKPSPKPKAKPHAAKSPGRAVGRTSKVGVQETWVLAFRNNEKDRKSDEAITKFMNSEFPGRKSDIFERVASVRSKYNKGGLTGGEVPKVQSRRFGEDGKEVTTRGFAIAPKGGASKGSASSKKKAKKA